VTLLREAKEDTVPTVAFADSFDGAGDSGTRSYYLASAHDQVYAQPTGQLGFTGNMHMPCRQLAAVSASCNHMVPHLSNQTALDRSPIAFACLHSQVLMVHYSGWHVAADWQLCTAAPCL
jgi:hypothetical protein